MAPVLGLVALSLLSHPCRAVRKQAAGLVPFVPHIPPVIPPYIGGPMVQPPAAAGLESMPPSRVNDGVAEYMGRRPSVAARMLERQFPGEFDDVLEELSMPFGFGLDALVPEELGRFAPFGESTLWAPWGGEPSRLPGEGVRRSVVITERNGERTRREEVTRCHEGKCTTEVVGDDRGAKMRADGGSAAPSKEQVIAGDADDADRRPSIAQRLGAIVNKAPQRAGSEALARRAGSGGGSPPPSFSSVSQTVVIRDVDGRRDGKVTVERCEDGRCTKEERRLAPKAEAPEREAGGSLKDFGVLGLPA